MVAQRWPTLCDTHAPTWVDLTGLPIHSHWASSVKSQNCASLARAVASSLHSLA